MVIQPEARAVFGDHPLDPLSDGEVRELFDGWLVRFGVFAMAGGAALKQRMARRSMWS